jgi:TetR/AcrR family transcriptional regulator, transcriptional repressor for nem operon
VEKTAANRGLGAETTRQQMLNAVERVFFKDGHARVSYRVVAARAGVTPGLVQYYFPTIDSLFAAMIQRLIDRDIDRWNDGLRGRPDEPLRVLWEYSWDEAAGAFGTEMMALGTRRPSLLALISEGTERIRRAQLQALERRYGDFTFLHDVFPPDAMVLLVTSLPKMLTLEDGVRVTMAHRSLIEAFERYLDTVEPTSKRRGPDRRRPKAPARGHRARENDHFRSAAPKSLK